MSAIDALAVATTSGRAAGLPPDKVGIRAFLGIPYAQAPSGSWRFRAPRPINNSTELLDATRFGPAAPQVLDEHAGSLADFGGDLFNEDCLNLNVWTPGLTGRRPVLVWIHGGGNTAGSSRRPDFDGSRLAAHDVVVVTINYRLGIFGFLDVSVLDDASHQSSVNNGLLDQLLALEWVKTNIAAFGGAPDNVTVFGNSAGASNISALLAIPHPEHYFCRAILQSGSATLTKSLTTAQQVSRRVFLKSNIHSVRELLKKTPSELLAIQLAGVADLSELEKDLAFQPTVDGELIKRMPLEAIRAGAARHIDLMIGTTRNELTLYQEYDPALLQATLDTLPGVAELSRAAKNRLWQIYSESRIQFTSAQIALDVGTDYWFRLPAVWMAEAQLRHRASVYMYLFDWPASDPRWGAPHAIELPFVFGNFEQGRMARFIELTDAKVRTDAERLSELVQNYWTSFARTGSPTANDGVRWPPYALDDRNTMVFNAVSAVIPDPSGRERRSFDGLSWENDACRS